MIRKIIAGLTIALMATTGHAHTMQDIAGVYDDSGVDSISQHYLLPNGEYCFVLVAGNLDLNFAGTWQIKNQSKDGTLIQLSPQALVKTPYPVWLNKKQTRHERVVKFITNRMLLSSADIFIGFGEQADKPTKFAPIFNNRADDLKKQYELSVPKNANYLFIGHQIDNDQFQLTRYPLSKDIKHTIQLGYDFNASYAEKFKQIQGRFKDNAMSFEIAGISDDESITKQAWKNKEDIAEVKTKCVDHVLHGNPLQLFPENSELLTPTTITWQGKPTQQSWF